MTSRERVLTALTGGCPDRVPVGPFLGYAAAPYAGASIRSYYTDGTTIARAQYAAWKQIGHDILLTAADTYYIAEGFGLQTEHHEAALPTVKRPLLDSLEEVEHLKVPDPIRDGRMPVYLEALRELRRLTGDRVALRGTGTGPFSLAAYLMGEEAFLTLLAMIEVGEAEEKEVHRLRRLMDITAATTLAFLRAQLAIGLDILYMGDSLASSDMVSPAMYRTWAFPWHRQIYDAVGDACRAAGTVTMLHICGRNDAVLRDFIATGVQLIEIDHKMDLRTCRAVAGPEISLIGNLDPVNTLLKGTPEEVVRASGQAVRDAEGSSGRFILGSGCFVPPGTPPENLRAMVAAARELETDTDNKTDTKDDTVD